jgi:hypothetical protein
MPVIHRQEWLWTITWSIVILTITSLPYLYGAAISTPTNQFGGFVIGVEDGNSYLAKTQEGWAGNWLFYLAYTPEPHGGAFFFIYYLLLGKLSRLLGLEPLLVLHLSRVFTIPFGLISFYYFVAFFTPSVSVRRIAFLLFGVTAGLGWLWISLGLPIELGAMPVDLWVPDASFFLSALTFPHLPLAQGLLFWVVFASLKFLDDGYLRWWALAAGAGLLVSFIHPYKLVILNTIFLAYLLWQAYKQKGSFWQGAWRLVLITAPSLPYLIYVLVVFETNFAFKAWREQSLTWSPHPIHYIFGFGLILPLVALGLWHAPRVPMKHSSFLTVWILVVPVLLYSPIPLQRRFLDGYQSALAVLGAIGLVWLVDRLRTGKQRLFIMTVVLILMILTNLFLLIGAVTIISGKRPPIFHPDYQQTAFHWLADHAQGQVVLTAYGTGNALPAYAPVRVFVGHGPETANSEAKQAKLPQFFAATNDDFRRQLLRNYGITYLFYGPTEQALGDFSPSSAPYLRQVYDNGEVQIYRFVDE